MVQGTKKKPRKMKRREKQEFEQKLLDLARVTRVVKGGRRFRFRATLVIGDKKGRVGVGIAKGSDVSDAITKAYADAKKKMISIQLEGNTIPHDIACKLGSAKVILKPAIEGRGLIAGGAVRTVVEFAGIRDIVSKSLGTSNKINVARATIVALASLKNIEKKVEVKNATEKKEKKAETVKDTKKSSVTPKKTVKESKAKSVAK